MAFPTIGLRGAGSRGLQRLVVASIGVVFATVAWSASGSVSATAPPDSQPPTTEPIGSDDEEGGTIKGGGNVRPEDVVPITLPLLPQPAGCPPMELPHVVFVGTVVAQDARTVKFHIDSVRGGTTDPYATNDEIDVRYGHEAQYLKVDERYVVSATRDPDLGLLVSRLTPPIEDFGGDEVIGVNESDLDCPKFDDPTRTLNPDGTPVDVNILEPLIEAKGEVLAALLVPAGIAFGVIFVLSLVRLSVNGAARLVFRRNQHYPPGL